MNPFGAPVEADGCRPQSAPPFCVLVLPQLRTRIGSSYFSFFDVLTTLVFWLVLTAGASLLLDSQKRPVWVDFFVHLGVLLALAVAAVRERVRTKVAELTRYSAVSRYYSGQPRLTHFLPDPMGWLGRLQAKSPRTAASAVRVLIPLYRLQEWFGRQPFWLLKAVFEPLLLLFVGGSCLLLWWLIGLPALFVGCHAATVAVILCWDQVNRSLALYEEVRANEEGAIVATRMAERLMGRRGP
jgi:hypothetical protein